MLNLCFVYDLGAETHTSDVYYTSSVLYFIVISKMAVSFFFIKIMTPLKILSTSNYVR